MMARSRKLGPRFCCMPGVLLCPRRIVTVSGADSLDQGAERSPRQCASAAESGPEWYLVATVTMSTPVLGQSESMTQRGQIGIGALHIRLPCAIKFKWKS